MTIRKRLIFSYLAMLFIPFILIMITGGVIRVTNPSTDWNNPGSFSEIDNDVLDRINQAELTSPESLLTPGFYNKLKADYKLSGVFAVLQDNRIKHPSGQIDSSAIMETINSQNNDSQLRGWKRHLSPEIQFSWEFSVPGESNGTLYYIFNPEQTYKEYFPAGLLLSIGIIVILILTNGTLTYLVSRSIVSPLKQLETAALKIRDGDLSGSISRRVDDEMGKVFSSFNEMRERLKDSLAKQISYEENRKELIASISHDLRTPLTVLKGYVEGLKDGVASTEEKKNHYLDTIYNKALQMDRLIDDFFLFSRLEMDKYPYEFVRMELSAWLVNAVKDLSVDYTSIEFKTSFIRKAYISADPSQLYRVISNIVQNSSYYADKKDIVISVTLDCTNRDAVITFTDNGIGISEDRLPFIFNRFFRGDDSRNQNSGGSGLGLSIAGMLISQQGGSIRAESPPGKGLSVIIRIPLLIESEGTTDG